MCGEFVFSNEHGLMVNSEVSGCRSENQSFKPPPPLCGGSLAALGAA